jgi:signal transduction histidine kinase/ligand-binding sensor domain-containing protein
MLRFLRSPVPWVMAVLPLTTNCFAAAFLSQGYAIRVWQVEDGLPQNLVACATQTADGYLWFGTHNGLARFDGERFVVFDPSNHPNLRDRRITSLFEDKNGSLWIGHETGMITRYRDGLFEPVARAGDDRHEKIMGIGSDEQGRVWAMREGGEVISLDSDVRLPSLIAPDLPAVMGWTRNARGNVWLNENGQIFRLSDGKPTAISFPPPLKDANYAHGIAASADGGLWVHSDARIRKWRDDRWVEDRGETPDSPVCLELHDGTLALGTTTEGLYLIFSDGRGTAHFDHLNGLPQDWIRFLFEDREGTFSLVNSPDQWKGCSILSVAPGRDGALWIGTDGAGLYHFAEGTWTHYGDPEGLGNAYIWAVAETSRGDVWASNYWWGGPYRLEHGRFMRPENVAANSSVVFALSPTTGGDELLVGNRDGLLQLKDDRSTWLVRPPNATAGAVCAVTRDARGSIWCGFAEGGLARLADGKTTYFSLKDGLASNSVQSLFSDGDGSLWIGTTDHGLSRFKDGRFSNLSVKHGLADQVICHILDDGLGYLWLSTHRGLQRIAKTELNRCADGAIPVVSSQIYDGNDGLPTVEFSGGLQAAGCRTTDGRLMFASGKGVVSVDPARIQPNPTRPPVMIDFILVDGAPSPFQAGHLSQRLSPEHERLEFRFSGLSFVAPGKVRFQYRLEGIDKQWVDVGTRRTAFYSRLRAGTYQFRVIACNNDGLWNTEGASLAFTVAPFFWETWWFMALCSLAAASAIALFARYLTRRRMQRRLDEMARQRELERERARIAQDIHDDVGASLSRIAMLSQTARGARAEPERTSAALSRIYDTAREITRALNEIVWALDPRHDTLDSLVDYMGKFAQEFLATAHLRCRLDLPVAVPSWPLTSEIRHNLFLAFKEALNNAVRHASATEVRISFALQTDAFVLTVKDNGRGIDPAAPAEAQPDRIVFGHGLPSMSRRLARIGGRCEITAEPDGGTSVAFIVAVPAKSGSSTKPVSNPSIDHA